LGIFHNITEGMGRNKNTTLGKNVMLRIVHHAGRGVLATTE
jgi:hypothetical protein